MDSQERNLPMTNTIDIPIPSEELPVEVGDFVEVEEVAKNSDHFSASYRRC